MILIILSIILLAGCNSEAVQDTSAVETSVVSETETVDVTPASLPSVTPSPIPTAAPTPTDIPEEESEEEQFEVSMIDHVKTMYTTDSLKVRKGPSKDYDVLGILPPGYEVEVNGRDKDGWYRIIFEDEAAFVSDDYLSEEAPTPTPAALPKTEVAEAPVPEIPEAELPAIPTVTPVPTVPPAAPVRNAAGVLMIGDSRCVMMQAATGGGAAWICENGKGYDWMMATAFPSADAVVGKGTKVVICLGVNDTNHAASYAAAINAKAAEWAQKGAKTYFVSVNPVWENPYTTEDKVIAFNATMAASLIGVKYVNTHDVLATTGYTMIDGLHYNDDTSKVIYNLIIGSVK
jgi:hypothetical protein